MYNALHITNFQAMKSNTSYPQLEEEEKNTKPACSTFAQ